MPLIVPANSKPSFSLSAQTEFTYSSGGIPLIILPHVLPSSVVFKIRFSEQNKSKIYEMNKNKSLLLVLE